MSLAEVQFATTGLSCFSVGNLLSMTYIYSRCGIVNFLLRTDKVLEQTSKRILAVCIKNKNKLKVN